MARKTSCDPRIECWLTAVEKGEVAACKDQKLLCKLVRKAFRTEDIYTDSALLDRYLGLAKYFPWERLFPWEEFCVALHLTTFRREDGRPRWPDLFCLCGRGAGKDGFIAFESLSVISPYSGLPKYDVDICANLEEQAMRPADDIREVLNDPKWHEKMKKHFYWTKEVIVGRKNGGAIKGRTNNPRSRDGMRSGMVVFNEIHGYENYQNIKVFVTGLGKTMHPRRLYMTTNGDVRGGVLDELLEQSVRILKGEEPDGGLLPFICRLDADEEVHDEAMWEKANPSLRYLPELREEIRKEYAEWKQNPLASGDFMTKRMNRPQTDTETAITDWENIAATDKELPDLSGWDCVCGIDYASISDFASVCLHFRKGDERYDISHSWLCLRSADLHRIRAPWREWVTAGKLTAVDAVEIHPDLIAEWICRMGTKYSIRKIAMDGYRHALLARSLDRIGFDAKERKNIALVRPSDIMKTVPVIGSVFANRQFSWGDAPVLRWAANNTKLVRAGRKFGFDTGNLVYAKIEGRSRKTDPFMALVAAMTIEGELSGTETADMQELPVFVF